MQLFAPFLVRTANSTSLPRTRRSSIFTYPFGSCPASRQTSTISRANGVARNCRLSWKVAEHLTYQWQLVCRYFLSHLRSGLLKTSYLRHHVCPIFSREETSAALGTRLTTSKSDWGTKGKLWAETTAYHPYTSLGAPTGSAAESCESQCAGRELAATSLKCYNREWRWNNTTGFK